MLGILAQWRRGLLARCRGYRRFPSGAARRVLKLVYLLRLFQVGSGKPPCGNSGTFGISEANNLRGAWGGPPIFRVLMNRHSGTPHDMGHFFWLFLIVLWQSTLAKEPSSAGFANSRIHAPPPTCTHVARGLVLVYARVYAEGATKKFF